MIKVCFGKHDSKHLLLCDGCDREYHTYCLEPKLTSIPSASWYCEDCLAAEKAKSSASTGAVGVGRASSTADGEAVSGEQSVNSAGSSSAGGDWEDR